MNSDELIVELAKLREIKRKVQKSLGEAPKGHMRGLMSRGKYPQYYVCSEGESNPPWGRYLKKEEVNLAIAYSQKEYDSRVLKYVEVREKIVEKMCEADYVSALSDIYTHLPEAKRRLVVPYVLPDEKYVAEWRTRFVTGGNSYPIENGYLTENGELVRSKSEKIIADKLFMKNIPYVYEPALDLQGGRTIFPDFALLNIRTREEYYLEHFGMMDDPEYCRSALEKIDFYTLNGIAQGDRLLTTFESSQKGISVKQIDLLIDTFLV